MLMFFFFKQKTAYEMRISDWSSDVCSSDLQPLPVAMPHEIGLPGLAQHYRMRLGDFCVVTGIPSHGKSTFLNEEIGRASCRERVCQYVSISVVAVPFKKKNHRPSYANL